MSILSVDTIQPIGSGTTITLNAAKIVVGTGITFESNGQAIYAGIITATSFVGSGANLTSLPAQATIANNADNRVITGGSGVNLNGEANLTFDSSELTLTSRHLLLGTDGYRIKLGTANDFQLWHTGSVNKIQGFVGDIEYISPAGSGHSFQVNSQEKLRITSAGLVGVNCTPVGMFEVQKNGVPANVVTPATLTLSKFV